MRVRGCARSPNRIRRLTLEPPPTAGRSGGRVGKAAAPTAASRLTCGRGVRCGCVVSVAYPDSQRLVRRDRRSGLRPSAKSARRACEGAFTRSKKCSRSRPRTRSRSHRGYSTPCSGRVGEREHRERRTYCRRLQRTLEVAAPRLADTDDDPGSPLDDAPD